MKKKILLPLGLLILICFSCTNTKTESKTNQQNQGNTVVENNVNPQPEAVKTSEKETIADQKAVAVAKGKVVASTTAVKPTPSKPLTAIDILRQKHACYLEESPFKKTLAMSEDDRIENGIPPNKYYESEWELTMNPETGRPTPENLILLREKLARDRKRSLDLGRTPGDGTDNNWVERGPTNVGGRTRAVMFDPNDATKETVFAGGVSGGLWKNTNISNASSVWVRVGIPENLAVSTITYDPNNTNIFYVGTGESYVGGDVNGDGVWKSVNGGVSFSKVFGGISGPTTFQSAANVTINSPAGVAGNYPGYPTTAFGQPIATAITSDLVLVNDGTATPTLACATLTNAAAISGKIALIRRGSCTFVEKVKAAQDAGATAVIMMNNISGQPIPMGGTDATITIPSVMISKTDGDALEAALAGGAVNATLNPSTPGAFTGNLVPGKQHINAIKVRNNGGVSEVYVAAGDSFYGSANATTYLGGPEYGLYKSVDGGGNWTEVALPLTANGNKHCPNDIEIAADNKIWVSTIASVVFNDGGGIVFSSTNGINFVQKYAVTGGARTQIAVSSTVPDKLYLLAELTAGNVTMKSTTTGFIFTTDLTSPVDADTGIPAADFARGQAFYDLMLEVDPSNDQTVYAGGIDLFKTTNSGISWNQLSHWSGNFGYQYVHSDQHGLAFANGASNKQVYGNDGGVYFSNNSGTTTTSRNLGFNVTQFYSLGVAPTTAVSGLTGDYFVAGAQDNGSQYFAGVSSGANAGVQAQGGDGASCMFDQGADKYYITNYVYNVNVNFRLAVSPFTVRTLSNDTSTATNGAFIAPMALDSNLDLLYADYSNTTTPAYIIRRYSSIKSGFVVRTNLTDALLTSSPTAITVSKYTTLSSKLLVGLRNGKLLRVTNANGTPVWADITGPAFVGSISDVEFGQSENQIFVTFHNYNVVSIWYSNDAGVTWQNKEGNFPDIPVKAILQNPLNANEVIIGTELGVWYTNTFNTASPVWNQSYNGMSNVKITDIDLRNDNAVYVATYGRGIFSGVFTATSLGTNDIVTDSKDIKVYPNPSNGVFNISIKQFVGNINLQVTDINGKVVYDIKNDSFNLEKTIDLSHLQSGMYILKGTADNLNFTEKIILK